MIARYQAILSQGNPRMDLGIVRLDYNFNNMIFTGDEKEIYESQLMRGNEGIYWKDMKLQNAGYTWDYFAPQLLEEDFVDVENNKLLPNGPGYRALIVYQNVLPIKTAEKLLKLAEKGLPILFVNGAKLAVAGAVAASLLPPLVLGRVVDRLTARQVVPFALALGYFGLLALSGGLDSLRESLLTVFGQRMTHALRSAMCAKLDKLPAEAFVNQESGAAVSRFVGDVDTVEELFTSGIISMFVSGYRRLF